MIPSDLHYTREHEWLRETDGGTFRIGITDFAQDSLGDIVFVALPEVGATVQAGEPMGEVESTKSVSEIYAPVGGTVTARNDAVETAPETINTDPYGDGWLVEISSPEPVDVTIFLGADDYASLAGG